MPISKKNCLYQGVRVDALKYSNFHTDICNFVWNGIFGIFENIIQVCRSITPILILNSFNLLPNIQKDTRLEQKRE